MQSTDLFVRGKDGYHTYRIPAMVTSTNGTLLAFCEGRKNSGGDSGATGHGCAGDPDATAAACKAGSFAGADTGG